MAGPGVIPNAKVAVVGAGAVGSSMAYACLIRRSARTVALYDVDRAKVEAEVLDLAHGALFTGAAEVEGGADPGVVEGAHVVVAARDESAVASAAELPPGTRVATSFPRCGA